MQIHIENFRGIKNALIECEQITLIAGINAAGKTSISQGTAAVLTGNPLPLAGMKKTAAGMLVHNGSAQGVITLRGENGTAVLSWPSAKQQTEGSPPQASAIAVGLESVADETRAADRARTLSPYLKSEPTQNDLSEALSGIKPNHLSRLWESIQINGWDLAFDQTKTKGAELKGRWHQVTGEPYGSKKAATWFPPNWEEDLDAASEALLTSGLTQDSKNLDIAISNKAIGDVELEALKKNATQVVNLAALELAVEEAQNIHWERIKARNALPPSGGESSSTSEVVCPHCANSVTVTKEVSGGFVLHKVEPLNKQEIRERGLAIASADGIVANAQDKLWEAQRLLSDGRQRVKEAETAQTQLEMIESREENTTSDQVEECRSLLQRAEARITAFRAKREADRLHAAVEGNQRIIQVLAPDGLRALKLVEAVRSLNDEVLGPLSHSAGWQAVSLNDDLMPALGGRLYPLLSESEQFRVRVTLQVAMAKMDNSAAVVIDRADILDRQGRNGLMRMLLQTSIPSLICMTILDPEKDPPPDLAAKGKGQTYWVAGGIAKPLNQFMEED